MAKKQLKRPISRAEQLGDFVLSSYLFDGLDDVMLSFQTDEFVKLNHKQKSDRVNKALLELIMNAPEGTFLLIAVLGFIDRLARESVLINYNLTSFEIWLNQFSGLSNVENLHVRGKIVGKWVPRDEYQRLFPIGMGKIHPGSHFVTAHASPDLDTTIASFWGWIDAFGARVSEGVHLWNVPGGPPQSSIEIALLFSHIFGQNVFNYLAKGRESLALSSLELMTQRGVLQQQTDQSSLAIDHERTQKAIVLIDEWGYYLGDWRSIDVEGVRQVIMTLNNALRWYENHLHIELVSLFAREELKKSDLPRFEKEMAGILIEECEPAKEFSDKQKRLIDGFLIKVLKVKKGLGATFGEFAKSIRELALFDFQQCFDHIGEIAKSDLFDQKGMLIEDRPKIFHYLEEMIAHLDRAIQSIRTYTERLEVALSIKTHVFGYYPQVVSYRADVDEIKSKMGSYPYLTVTSSDDEGKMLPLGVVRSRDLQKPILGTVTVRDFCNRNETKIPSYLEIISTIDHHKVNLQTSSTIVAHISDAQSSNTVVAELAFAINDRYSTNGMTKDQIHAQIKEVQKDLSRPENKRILQRLLARLAAAEDRGGAYFVDPLREFIEYLHFLYAILDDTDLLTKVSNRDVEVVMSLLNRMKSLMEGKEMEIIHFDDLSHDEAFVHNAAIGILRHRDMYSLYRKIYLAKEQLVEENIALCAKGKESSIFVDTKLQNGCVRVGQTKMFAKNFPTFHSHERAIKKIWGQNAQGFFEDRRDCDLHLQMISTIAGAEDLYSGSNGHYMHLDQLWIWIPMTEQGIEHLKSFLNAFRSSPQMQKYEKEVHVEVEGVYASELKRIFAESFSTKADLIKEKKGKGTTLASIKFPAGAINSRKAMISPYLPQPVS